MKALIFRALKEEEIYARAAMVREKGVSLLLYKDARVDMTLLDEVVGPWNWKKSYTRDNHNCLVEIWDDDKKQWIGKEDVGTESNTEAEKGLASDAFKRACFCWGIGRELYTSPFIWIPAAKTEIIKGSKGNLICNDKWSVLDLEYVEDGGRRIISAFRLKNLRTGQIDFTYRRPATEKKTPAVEKVQDKPQEKQPTHIDNIKFLADSHGVPIHYIIGKFDVKSLEDIPEGKMIAMERNFQKVIDSYKKEIDLPFS